MTNACVPIANRGEIAVRSQRRAAADAMPCTGIPDQNKSR
jgi:hypothetical protein